MRLLWSGLLPRALLGIVSFQTLLLAVSSVQELLANGPSTNALLMLLFAGPLALLSFWAAAGRVDLGFER